VSDLWRSRVDSGRDGVARRSQWVPAVEYNFDCPGWLTVVTKLADERIVRELASGGVSVREWTPPRQLPEGPPLTFDELLDLLRFERYRGCLRPENSGKQYRRAVKATTERGRRRDGTSRDSWPSR
jgi:hypothetical protein